MKLFRCLKDIPLLQSGSIVTIGNFDGVHLGHQALLSTLREKEQFRHLPLVVVLFEPQPSEFFQPDNAPVRISSLREKLLLLAQCQVDIVCCCSFNAALAQTPADDFARYIFSSLHCKYLLVGEDFRFGCQRLGNVSLLKASGIQYQCKVDGFPDVILNDSRVSSTKVRAYLHDGLLHHAQKILGRTYSLCGRVVHGDARGREWGIPTANLALNRHSLALKGVFCVKIKRKNQWYNGVANIGRRPSVDGYKNSLEVHFFDFNENLYGELIHVFFLHKLRDEVKFNAIDALVKQIHHDVAHAKHYFQNTHDPDDLIE